MCSSLLKLKLVVTAIFVVLPVLMMITEKKQEISICRKIFSLKKVEKSSQNHPAFTFTFLMSKIYVGIKKLEEDLLK